MKIKIVNNGSDTYYKGFTGKWIVDFRLIPKFLVNEVILDSTWARLHFMKIWDGLSLFVAWLVFDCAADRKIDTFYIIGKMIKMVGCSIAYHAFGIHTYFYHHVQPLSPITDEFRFSWVDLLLSIFVFILLHFFGTRFKVVNHSIEDF